MIYILIVISILVHWVWIFTNGIITYGDWGYFYRETQIEFSQLPRVWIESGLGQVDYGIPIYPIVFAFGLLGHITNFPISERILFLYPITIVTPIASYLLLRNTFKRIPAVMGSLIYSFNTYFLMIQTGHLTLMVVYAIAPLIILFVKKST